MESLLNEQSSSYSTHKLENELYLLYRQGKNPDLSQLNPADFQARTDFWNNAEALLNKIGKEAQKGPGRRGLEGEELYINLTKTITKFVNEFTTSNSKTSNLDNHLTSVTDYLSNLTELFDSGNRGRKPLQKKHLSLLKNIVGPLHDIIKKLSSRGQVSTDHQVVIQHILSKYGKKLGLKKEADLRFCSEIIGDHENASSLSRAELLAAEEGKSINERAIIHGKALFYLADTFTGVLKVVDQNGPRKFELDAEALVQRFQDILERRNDPLISRYTEPEWAILAYTDYKAVLQLIGTTYEIAIPKDALLAVLETAIRSFEGLINKFKVRDQDSHLLKRKDKQEKALPIGSISQFEKIVDQLRKLANEEREEQKEMTTSLLITRLENLSLSLASGQLSEGGRLARAVQKSYEIVEEEQIVPDAEAIEIDSIDYQKKVDKKFQAFNLVAVSTATNLVYYYLKSPLHQEAIVQFFGQDKEEAFALEKIKNNPSLAQLAEELAAQLHNQYVTTLGDGKMWSQLSTTERGKKEKSYIMAMQLLRNIFDYLGNTDLNQNLILPLGERNQLRETNFANPHNSDIANYMSPTADEIRMAARSAHQWWRAAKLKNNPNEKVLEFNQLSEPQRIKSLATTAMAIENIARDLSKEKELSIPLKKLAELINYLFQMIKTANNVKYKNETNSNLVNWAEKLTAMCYKTWLMSDLTQNDGLDKLSRLGKEGYFSILAKTKEDQAYVQLGELSLSYKDLDRIPLLCAAITMYLAYYEKIFTIHQKFLEKKQAEHQEEMAQIKKIMEEIAFFNLEEQAAT